MTIKIFTKEIDGTVYKVRQLPSLEALDLFENVVRIMAPNAGSVVDAAGVGERLTQIVAFATANGLKAFGHSLTGKVLRTELVDAFRKTTCFVVHDGGEVREPELSKDAIFNEHFAGRLVAMFEWVRFCLEINFGDFTDPIKSRLRPLVDLMKRLQELDDAQRAKDSSPDPSLQEFDGSSGESRPTGETATD